MCDVKIILWTFLFVFVFIIESECKKTKFTAGHMEKLNLCSLDIDEGDCGTYDSISSEDEDNSTVSYGYNNETMKCEEFIYEGCGGNDNRFDSMHECWRMCYTPLKYFLARATDYLVYRYTNLSNETTSAQKSEQEER